MKKLKFLLLTIVAATALQSVYGQAQLALGIKAGLNFANVNTTSAGAAYDSRAGFHAGAFFQAKFAKFGLQPEVIFSQQGSTIKFSGQSFDSNFSYVNIPIILKLYLAGGFNLQAGPQFGFLMSADGPVTNLSGVTTIGDVKNQLNGSDISIGLGAGVDLPFGLTIDGRYNLGVSDNNNSANSGSTDAVKNQVIQVSVGYKLFKFGK